MQERSKSKTNSGTTHQSKRSPVKPEIQTTQPTTTIITINNQNKRKCTSVTTLQYHSHQSNTTGSNITKSNNLHYTNPSKPQNQPITTNQTAGTTKPKIHKPQQCKNTHPPRNPEPRVHPKRKIQAKSKIQPNPNPFKTT